MCNVTQMESVDTARVTMTRVADRAGVSVMTVSYVYNRPERVSAASREKVLAAAAELRFAGPDPSARSLRTRSTGVVGVVLGEHLTYAFDDPQATSFLAGVAEVCTEQGLGLQLLPVGGPADADRIAAAAVDAFVVWTLADDDPILDAVLATRRPAVVHGGSARPGLRWVSIDNRAAAEAVARAALAGARRPAVVSFPLDRRRIPGLVFGPDPAVSSFPVTRDRLAGFRAAAGSMWPDLPVVVCATNDRREAADGVARLLAAHPDVDAVIAMSDQLALGAMVTIRAHHRDVPGDVAVSGWDDDAVAVRADLTTVRQDLRAQGAACARGALGGVDAVPASWEVVVRGSTR